MIYRFIDTHRRNGVDDWPVKKMAKVLEVSPASYYAWRTHRKSDKQQMDETVIREITTIQ